VIQPEPRGTADAILAAADWVGEASFLAVNGDNLYPVAALRRLRDLDGPGVVGFSRAGLVSSGNRRQ
jgi:glucose-1-phosphate thymidylyltransferase